MSRFQVVTNDAQEDLILDLEDYTQEELDVINKVFGLTKGTQTIRISWLKAEGCVER